MIKGCSKRVVHLKNTDSAIFEEAYFVLGHGSDTERVSDRDMIREAERRVCESSGREVALAPRRRGRAYYFALGGVCATLLYLLIGAAVYLFA